MLLQGEMFFLESIIGKVGVHNFLVEFPISFTQYSRKSVPDGVHNLGFPKGL